MKNPTSKISTILISLVMALSACAPSSKRTINDGKGQQAITNNDDDADLPPEVEQDLVSTEDSIQKSIEEKGTKAEDYVIESQNIKNGDDIMYVGYTKLKNIKSIYNRNTKELEVSGLAEIMNADKKTLRASQKFQIKGIFNAEDSSFELRPVTEETDANAVQVRAVVDCRQNSLEGKTDCAHAVIDVILKHQANYYTEQLEATSLAKPKIIGGTDTQKKSAPNAPEVKIEITEPEIQNEVKNTPDQPAQPEQKKPVIDTNIIITPAASATTPAAPAKPKAVIDESKDGINEAALAEIAEGDDDSIAGRYEGKAALVKLVNLFLSPKDIAELDASDAKDKATAATKKDAHAITPEVKKDTRGRLMLTNQAVGSPDEGRLRNASFLKTHLDTYKLNDRIVMANTTSKNYYGTQEMMNVLEATGDKAFSYEQNKIYISRISAKNGGLLPPSKSHQNGMDADIGYPTVQGKISFPVVASGGSLQSSDFSAAKTLELFKFLFTQNVSPVDRLFVDQAIINKLCGVAKEQGKFRGSEKATFVRIFENIQHVEGHGNHYHLRLRCTPNQPDCRYKIYKKMNNCAAG
ncbi:hypothetical protein CIK05_09770 [Bdellovibrio sp. qaytius]|nr:hypothetical protein CIK05_09770 [Bdellovibrio sp. qaytius]